ANVETSEKTKVAKFINTQNGEHGTALQAASFYGHIHIVKELLQKGADVDIQG
ncbi:hypothetical protein DM02DRAFT_476962, partial [Periconia macrospinosa]